MGQDPGMGLEETAQMCGGSFKKEREEAESRAGRARREWGGVGGWM